MTKKLAIHRYFWIISIVVLVACAKQIGSLTPTNAPNLNGTVQPAALTMVAQTMTAIPTSTLLPTVPFFTSTQRISQIPTSTFIPTNTALSFTPAPTLTPLPFVALEGLRVAYTIGGDLYVQDSGKQPIQLTRSGQDRSPVFSDDGQKIVFFREWETEMNQLYVVNADGTGERALVTSELLIFLGRGYDEFTEPHSAGFVPGTHLLLFNTGYYTPYYPKTGSSRPNPTNDLLLVDTDTGGIKRLAGIGQGGFFLASPNGKWVAVQTPDHVDVIDLQGGFILHNLFNHSPDDYDCVFYGYICAPMYWKQDSSELILVQPLSPSEYPAVGSHPLPRTVWQYPINGRPGKEIRLAPANPMGEALSVSPDGNWIAFSLFDIGDQDGVYLGNLRDGTSQSIYKPVNEVSGEREPAPLYYYGWSPDSVHFVFGDWGWGSRFIGNIQGETTPLGGMSILGWIDNSRYFGGSFMGDIDNQEEVLVIDFPPGVDPYDESPVAFVFLGH